MLSRKAPFLILDCAELNGGRPAKSPDYDVADLRRSREFELLLAVAPPSRQGDDVPTNPAVSVRPSAAERVWRRGDSATIRAEHSALFDSLTDKERRI
jgi:hypothetical protein